MRSLSLLKNSRVVSIAKTATAVGDKIVVSINGR